MMAFTQGGWTTTVVLFSFWMTCQTQSDYRRPTSPWFPREDGVTCTVWNQSGCRKDECCIKEVISFKDLDKNMLVSTRCKPLLKTGELCLREPEGYLCDCAKGLLCKFQKNETYGHCAPG